VITVRVCCPHALTADVVERLQQDPLTSALAVYSGASRTPVGDIIEADLPREAVNPVVDALMELGVQEDGTIQLIPVATWVSERALAAERLAPGAGADAVVWADVVERAYEESSLTFTYVSFMVLATLLAAIAVVTDSAILVIGAMVLGPEFVPIAALGLGLVRKRYGLFRRALSTLVVGFAVSITAVAALSLVARACGLITAADVEPQGRLGTSFIYSPNIWSLIVAVIAGAAGVLALTSAKSGGLVGVFISVTTIPASGNIAVAAVFGLWSEVWGSAVTLVVNITGMAIAGWLTLWLQQSVWGQGRGRPPRNSRSADGEAGADHRGQ
jgi:uncharacterized hydrophobic protein (TIGR00271 family)